MIELIESLLGFEWLFLLEEEPLLKPTKISSRQRECQWLQDTYRVVFAIVFAILGLPTWNRSDRHLDTPKKANLLLDNRSAGSTM